MKKELQQLLIGWTAALAMIAIFCAIMVRENKGIERYTRVRNMRRVKEYDWNNGKVCEY